MGKNVRFLKMKLIFIVFNLSSHLIEMRDLEIILEEFKLEQLEVLLQLLF
jgi:hypothetical protein